MQTDLLLLLYCVAIVLASLAGGWLPWWIRLTHTRMQVMMSAVSGLMLGVAVLHLLPHSMEYLAGSIFTAAAWMLVGILAMFFLIRTFHFHQHGVAEEPADGEHDHDHDHDHSHGHDHGHHHQHGHGHGGAGSVSWAGLALGLSLHTLIDGVALGAAMSAEAEHDGFALAGLGVFLAIVLHKPLDALSISSVMASDHWPPRARTFVNAGFAMMAPLGAILFRFSVAGMEQQFAMVVGGALAFSAGVFLCISLGDLLPELQFHSHDRVKLSAALLLGVALAVGIELLPGHSHGPEDNAGHHHPSGAHHDDD